jgi:hypothetical protein
MLQLSDLVEIINDNPSQFRAGNKNSPCFPPITGVGVRRVVGLTDGQGGDI